MEEIKPVELIPPGPKLDIVSPAEKPADPPHTETIVTQPLAVTGQQPAAASQTTGTSQASPAPVELVPGPAATTPAAASTPAKTQSTEIKLVITLNSSGTALVGISRTGTDPLFFNVEGSTIPDVMKAMPGLLVVASKKWAVSAKYPKAPDLPGTTTTTTTSTPARKPAATPGTKKQPAMPGM